MTRIRMKLREERDYWRDMYSKRQEHIADEVQKELQIRVRKLDVKAGDTIAVMTPGVVSFETAQRLTKHFEEHLPGVKALVMGDGLQVEVVKKDETTEAEDLREVIQKIEDVARKSRAWSMINRIVYNCTDHISAMAAVIEQRNKK